MELYEVWIFVLVTILLYFLGIFLFRKKEKEVAPIIYYSITPTIQSKRKLVRKEGNPTRIFIKDNHSTMDGWVIDRNAEGLGIMLGSPEYHEILRVDDIIDVRAYEAPKQYPWSKLEIKHIDFQKDYWVIGCKFVEPQSTFILMSFYQ